MKPLPGEAGGRRPDPAGLQERLARAWSPQTSSQWRPENRACGQCSVTALAVQQLCGGDILKTPTPGGAHFYNRIDGHRRDFTASQFDRPPPYADLPSDAEEAMADTSPAQLASLLRALGGTP